MSERNHLLDGCIFYTALDPASGEERLRKGDDSAIVTAGVKWIEKAVCLYVVEERGGQWRPDLVVTGLVRVIENWRPRKVLIETNVARAWLTTPIRQKFRESAIPQSIIEEIPRAGRKSKSDYISDLITAYHYRHIWHARSLKGGKLEENLMRFSPGSTAHDDYADALAMIYAYAVSVGPRAVQGQQRKFSMFGSGDFRYPSTGV